MLSLEQINKKLESKSEKIKLYSLAKNIYIDNLENSVECGMCYCIEKAARIIYQEDVFDYPTMLRVFFSIAELNIPEFINIKPINKYFNEFWWSRHDKKVRLKKFNELINI